MFIFKVVFHDVTNNDKPETMIYQAHNIGQIVKHMSEGLEKQVVLIERLIEIVDSGSVKEWHAPIKEDKKK